MSIRRLFLVCAVFIVAVLAVLFFGNNVLMKFNTEMYMKMSFIRTYNNITKKNKDMKELIESLGDKPLNIALSAETTNTNIGISGFKIKKVSLSSDLHWDREYTFFAENIIRLGVFRLAEINIFGDKDVVGFQVPKVVDEYIMFDKSNLLKDYFADEVKELPEIVEDTVSLFSGAVYSYEGKEAITVSGLSMNLHKIKTVLLKNDLNLYIQKINQNIRVTDDVTIYLYTNEIHEIAAFELTETDALPFEAEIRFALCGKEWLLSEFIYDINIFSGEKFKSQAHSGVYLYEKNKIALAIEPVSIETDYFREDTKIDAKVILVIGESHNDITFPKNKSIKSGDMLMECVKDIISKWYEINSVFQIP